MWVTGWSERERRALPRLHLVTADEELAAPGFLPSALDALRAGGPEVALHLRGPGTPGRRLFELAERLGEAARAAGGLLLVNDRVDVALAAGAAGVQLGGRAMKAADARRLAGNRLLGASVHSLEEGRAAAEAGADFLLAGTLFPSASHPGRPGAGTRWLAELAALHRPVVGIGGIDAGRVRAVLAAGAWGVAVRSAVWSAARPGPAVRELLARISLDARG